MAIILCLDDVLAQRKVTVTELAEAVGITRVNMSLLKSGKVKAIRLSTLDGICRYLGCTPGDIVKYEADAPEPSGVPEISDVAGLATHVEPEE